MTEVRCWYSVVLARVIFQPQTADFLLCPHKMEKAGDLSGVPLIRVLIPCMRASSHDLFTSQSLTF